MTTYIHNVVPTRWLLPSSTVTRRVRQGLLRLRAVLVAAGQQEARGAD